MGFIKVAIADDHKIFRKGVILSLRAYSNIKFVQEAENGQELLDGLAGIPAGCYPDGSAHATERWYRNHQDRSPNYTRRSISLPLPCMKTNASSAI